MVTRETVLREGLLALGLDPAAATRLARFEELLASVALPRGLLGPHEAGRLTERHLLESAALAPLLPREGLLIDVGSGAGLPGVVLACLREGPTLLLDAEGKRVRFLEEVVEELGLGCTVLQARAEEAARYPWLREQCEAAVARALAPPAVALELVLPFVRPGGRAVLAVSPPLPPGLSAVAGLLGGGEPDLVPLQVPGLEGSRWAMIVAKVGVVPERYPRRPGIPAKRPLGGGRRAARGRGTA